MGLPHADSSPAMECQFTPQQYRVLVKQVYQEKNPSMIGELDFIFSRYEGREEELFSQVCLKYGADKASLTECLPPRTQLEEDELVEAIVQLEEEHERRMRLLRRKKEEVKELTFLIRLGSERRRCHACDLGLCRAKRLARHAGEVCWLVAEEARCAEEEAGGNQHCHEHEEDLLRGTQWVIKELRAILPSVTQEDPQLAELAHHLSNALKLQKPQGNSDPHAPHVPNAHADEPHGRDNESEHWDPQEIEAMEEQVVQGEALGDERSIVTTVSQETQEPFAAERTEEPRGEEARENQDAAAKNFSLPSHGP
eukprot:Skav225261  [mRNA]  locus=scaffold4099:61030:61962:+ [translate_table: standard]